MVSTIYYRKRWRHRGWVVTLWRGKIKKMRKKVRILQQGKIINALMKRIGVEVWEKNADDYIYLKQIFSIFSNVFGSNHKP